MSVGTIDWSDSVENHCEMGTTTSLFPLDGRFQASVQAKIPTFIIPKCV